MNRGYTLVELIVALGLFSIVMLLATGAYFMMINVTRHAQATATGTDNLSFALESMTRTIRTGTSYACDGGNCSGGGNFFTFSDASGTTVTYSKGSCTAGSGTAIIAYIGSGGSPSCYELTDPSTVISNLKFYVVGTAPASAGDSEQPHVTIVAQGSVSAGPQVSLPFNVETGATMRGIDI